MKIVVDHIPTCSSDCIFSRYFSCERRRCILTDNICSLDNDIPGKCHKLTLYDNNKDFEKQAIQYADEITRFKDYITLEDVYEFFKHLSEERDKKKGE